jgi:hypothetical protein
MKIRYLLVPLTAIALTGCAVYPPSVAYQPAVVTTPAPVAVAPAYVAPAGGVIIR